MHAPDGSTTATNAPYNKARGLALSILLTSPLIMMPFGFDLELIVLITACMHYRCMHVIIATYVPSIWYVTRGMLA